MKTASRILPQSAAKIARRAALLALAGALTFSAGCFGICPLTKVTYKFNKESSQNEFVQSVMFWVLSPVYAVSIFGDVLVLNPVEFWSGQTLDLGVSRALAPEVEYEVSDAAKEMLGEKPDARLTLRASNGRFEIRDASTGRLAGTIYPTEGGGAALYSAEGAFLREFPRVS